MTHDHKSIQFHLYHNEVILIFNMKRRKLASYDKHMSEQMLKYSALTHHDLVATAGAFMTHARNNFTAEAVRDPKVARQIAVLAMWYFQFRLETGFLKKIKLKSAQALHITFLDEAHPTAPAFPRITIGSGPYEKLGGMLIDLPEIDRLDLWNVDTMADHDRVIK